MFAFKKQEELEKMTGEEIKAYQDALEKHRTDTMKNEVSTEVSKSINKATETLKEFLANEIKAQLAETSNVEVKSVKDVILGALIENKSEIERVFKAGAGVVELFTTKAPGTITTQSGTFNTPPKPVGTDLAPLSNVNLRQMSIEDYATQINTSTSTYSFTEAVPKDGDYSFVAEGAVKPQIDFTWETSYAQPKKIAAWLRLTMESIQDIAGLESVANDLLRKKHDLFKQKALLFGTGVGNEPTGATVYGRLFSAGDLALSVTNPNIMDVINAGITDIATTHNYQDELEYRANFVAISPTDFFIHFVSAKDNEGRPLYPTATLFNMVNIGGVTVWADRSVPAGKILIADMSKYYVTNYMPYTVKIGWVNDDFIKNQFIILAESRFHAFVKKLDQQAFIYDDIQTIKDAIAKP